MEQTAPEPARPAPVLFADCPELMSAERVARALGVSRQTVWSWFRAGALPCVRIGRRVFCPRAMLAEYVARELEK